MSSQEFEISGDLREYQRALSSWDNEGGVQICDLHRTQRQAMIIPTLRQNPSVAAGEGALTSAITFQEGEATIEASYLAAQLGLTTERLRAEMRRGIVYGVTERGHGEDQGRKRLTVRCRDRSWSVIVEPDGSFKEVIKRREARLDLPELPSCVLSSAEPARHDDQPLAG